MLNSHYTTHLPVFTDVSDVRYPPSPSMGDALQLLASKWRGFTQLAARSGVGAFIGCFGVRETNARGVLPCSSTRA